jgi:hypothetical protein
VLFTKPLQKWGIIFEIPEFQNQEICRYIEEEEEEEEEVTYILRYYNVSQMILYITEPVFSFHPFTLLIINDKQIILRCFLKVDLPM